MQFDQEKLLKHFDNDKDMISELVDVFAESYVVSLSALKLSLNQKDYTEIELHAHTLKGMLGNFFPPSLTEASSKLELMGRNQSLDGYEKELQTLEQGIPVLLNELRSFCG